MNAKARFYSAVARETISRMTTSLDNWTSFLNTLARNYKFTYPEQVMIYAQRPGATLCKPYDEWNNENYRRYVKRGSTGIALFVMNKDKPYLRYVFDVKDTGVRPSSPELETWSVTDENRRYIMEMMEQRFDVKAEGLLEVQLESIAINLTADYWSDNRKQFLDIVANSYLEDYDELNIEAVFKSTVVNSVSYALYSRLVENPADYFEQDDFRNIFEFNSRQTVNALGTAVNAVSTRLFQEIERAAKEFEQSRNAERSMYDERDDIQTSRGLPDTGYDAGERNAETVGQIRKDMPLVGQFITDDEINADLGHGSSFIGGKGRIYEYWQTKHTTKEKADFLKKEYGIGGHSHACSGATHSSQEHSAKGLTYKKVGCDQINLSWTLVAQRIDALMAKNRYLNAEEKAEKKAIEEARMEIPESIADRFGVVDTEDGEYAIWDEQNGDYYVDADGVTEYFTDEWLANDYLEKVRRNAVEEEMEQDDLSADISDQETTLAETMPEQDEQVSSEILSEQAYNFHITDEHLGEGGPKQKFRANITMISVIS